MLRPSRLSLLAALVFVVAVAAPAGASTERSGRAVARAGVLENQVLDAINATRLQHGLRPLHASLRLDAAAAQHSAQMARDGYFSHSSANGTAFWRRIQRYYRARGYRFWSVGENLLWSSPGIDADGAMKMWMASPEHRANLLTPRWREVGVSAVHVVSAPGVYGGHEVTIVTTDFGVRR